MMFTEPNKEWLAGIFSWISRSACGFCALVFFFFLPFISLILWMKLQQLSFVGALELYTHWSCFDKFCFHSLSMVLHEYLFIINNSNVLGHTNSNSVPD